MSISNEETEYLQSLVNAMGEIRIKYKRSNNSAEKREIKDKYKEYSKLYNDFFNRLLEEDIQFTQDHVDEIKAIGKRISQATDHQQLIIAMAELAVKYAI